MEIQKRKAISAFGLDLTSFPLVCMFFASILVLGQTATTYQADNPFGLSNAFGNNNNVSPFTNINGQPIIPNLQNVTFEGKETLTPQQSNGVNSNCAPTAGWLATIATIIPIFGIFIATGLGSACIVITTVPNIVSNIFFGIVVSSGSPANVQIGFLVIIIFLASTVLITGISVLGTGLNTASIFLLFQMGGYTLIWLLVSGLAFPVFNGNSNAIPQPFGNLFYLLLTMMYTFGIFRRVT